VRPHRLAFTPTQNEAFRAAAFAPRPHQFGELGDRGVRAIENALCHFIEWDSSARLKSIAASHMS
jgi:hypothetical protein